MADGTVGTVHGAVGTAAGAAGLDQFSGRSSSVMPLHSPSGLIPFSIPSGPMAIGLYGMRYSGRARSTVRRMRMVRTTMMSIADTRPLIQGERALLVASLLTRQARPRTKMNSSRAAADLRRA